MDQDTTLSILDVELCKISTLNSFIWLNDL